MWPYNAQQSKDRRFFFYTYKRTQIIVPDTVLYTPDPTYTPVYRSAHFIFFINIQGADKIIRLRLPSLPLALLNVLTSITLFVSSRYLENKSQICPQEGARSSFFFHISIRSVTRDGGGMKIHTSLSLNKFENFRDVGVDGISNSG